MLSRNTIDIGIDLGTTNSAIALLRGTVPEILKESLENTDVIPSVVCIDKHGSYQVGQRAKNKLKDERAVDDVHFQFKRRMGTDYVYEFPGAGARMSAEQLSAEVLKVLRANARPHLGEEVRCAVITVPAAFEQQQCAATKHAAELAGLEQCPLLQEPVAAALAYGFQRETSKANWLVYDFGGGTFDAAILRADDGTLTVVNHGGDNYLGGSDIDQAIVRQLVLPELQRNYDLSGLWGNDNRWRAALNRIRFAAEEAKIELSRSDSTYVVLEGFKDAQGSAVNMDVRVNRDEIVTLAEPMIMRSVDICKRVMREKNLGPAAIERIILVGGPTLAPYFREILETSLGVPLDFSVDPLTVVARGAAVFAGTQRNGWSGMPKASAGQYTVNLQYDPVGVDEDPTVRGSVEAQPSTSVSGFTIEFVNEESPTKWRSGKITLKDDGRFKVTLLAERGVRNTYAIELLDRTGDRHTTVPDSFTYTVGAAITEQPITISLAVALANNEADVFFRKGDPLPAKATRIYRTTHQVRKGSEEDILNAPVVEGENGLADRNRLLGTLRVKGTEIRRDVPTGSEVELTLEIDESRLMRAVAYMPILDEEYEAVFDHKGVDPDPAQLQREYEAEMDRLESIRRTAEETDYFNARQLLGQLDDANDLEELERRIESASTDFDASKQADTRLREFRIRLDEIEGALEWPALVTEVNQALDELADLVEDYGTAEQKERASTLRQQAADFIEQKRIEPLKRCKASVEELQREIYAEQPWFWGGFFSHLIGQQHLLPHSVEANRLFNQGRQCIDNGDVEGLRSVVIGLLRLIPQEEADAIQRGYQSSLLR